MNAMHDASVHYRHAGLCEETRPHQRGCLPFAGMQLGRARVRGIRAEILTPHPPVSPLWETPQCHVELCRPRGDSMKIGRIAGAILIVLLFGCRAASAGPCVVTSRPIYNLVADTVNWMMKVGSDHRCLRGVRYAKVQFERMTLVSSPRSGHVVLQGSAFTYTPKNDFQGDDTFDVEVAGQIQKIRGTSTIHIVVSVVRAEPPQVH
jgi:hypothetical protein